MTLLMALLAGLQGVRAAVCSQVGLHPVPGPLNALRAHLRLPRLLQGLDIRTLTTTEAGSSWLDRWTARLAGLLPTRERCAHPVCRRILFLYGEVFAHDQLTQATHDALGEVFGVANLTGFAHITRILRAGHVVDHRGAKNRLFVPQGTARTWAHLSSRTGRRRFTRHVVPGVAHLDALIGRAAVRAVYPIIRARLEGSPF
jgi:hypothetical protein